MYGCSWQVAGDRPPLDWKTLIHRKNQELMRLSSLYEQNLKSAGVEQIEGKGKITGRESVSVNGKTFKVGVTFYRPVSKLLKA